MAHRANRFGATGHRATADVALWPAAPIRGGDAVSVAALLLSDELHEQREQRENGTLQAVKPEPKISRRLKGLAKRAEAIADSSETLPLTGRPDEARETVAARPDHP